MKATTAWGEISASWIYGEGEIHISHEGALHGQSAALEKVVTALKGRTKSLSGTHWVVAVKEANEAKAKAFVEAIASLASNEGADGKKAKAVARKRR